MRSPAGVDAPGDGAPPAAPVSRLRRALTGVRHTRGAAVASSVAVLTVGILIGALLLRPPSPSAVAATPNASVSASATKTPSIGDVYAGALPSVVTVTADKKSAGSGVVATKTGNILTAAHVVRGATTVTVVFSDGTSSSATVESSDAATDIAVLKPATLPATLVPATLGGRAEIGSLVIAIGNPLGLTASVSSGIVSGLGRDATTANGHFTGLIQFDAAANPGSSGGPLLDIGGNVVGIVVSIADPGGDGAFAGIGFAVPIGAAVGGGGTGANRQTGPRI